MRPRGMLVGSAYGEERGQRQAGRQGCHEGHRSAGWCHGRRQGSCSRRAAQAEQPHVPPAHLSIVRALAAGCGKPACLAAPLVAAAALEAASSGSEAAGRFCGSMRLGRGISANQACTHKGERED